MVLDEQLIHYANYHRDPRNIATHMVGIPMIMLAISVMLARPAYGIGGLQITPAWILAGLVAVFYYGMLSWRVGIVMALVLAAFNLLGEALVQTELGFWRWGLGLFVVGWAFQFVGHKWEGKKPAFADDLRGLLQGPMFVAFELGFKLGLFKHLQAQIEEACGPIRRNPNAKLSAVDQLQP